MMMFTSSSSNNWNCLRLLLVLILLALICKIQEAVPIGCTYSANDKDTCDATTLDNGQACTWCIWKSAQRGFCVSEVQAKSMQKEYTDLICHNNRSHEDENPAIKKREDDNDDPCTMATFMKGNKRDSCLATKDVSEKSCEWCDLGDYVHVCISSWQAQKAQEFGATCETNNNNNSAGITKKIKQLRALEKSSSNNPDVLVESSSSCTVATVNNGGDKASCLAHSTEDGQPCEWCTFGDKLISLCLSPIEAQAAFHLGVACSSTTTLDTTTSSITAAKAEIKSEDDNNSPVVEKIPAVLDTSCLVAMIQGGFDKSKCIGTYDSSGTLCEWCTVSHSFGMLNLCFNSEQAHFVETIGTMKCTKKQKPSLEIVVVAE